MRPAAGGVTGRDAGASLASAEREDFEMRGVPTETLRSLTPRGLDDILDGIRVASGGTVPYSSAKRRDVDAIGSAGSGMTRCPHLKLKPRMRVQVSPRSSDRQAD